MRKHFHLGGIAGILIFTTIAVGSDLDIANKTPSEYLQLVKEGKITLPGLCHLLHTLPLTEKASVRLNVKNERAIAANTSQVAPGTYDTYLIALDDEPTIEKFLKLFRQSPSDAAFDLISSSNPNVIKLLGDDILGPNQLRGGKDVVIYGPASETWSLVREIIATAPEFSQDVKDWAKGMPEQFLPNNPEPNETKVGNIVRAWWKENRTFFHTAQFDKVQPGERFEFSYPPPASKNLNEKNSIDQSAVTVVPLTPSTHGGWEAFGLVGGMLLLATAFLALRRKKGN